MYWKGLLTILFVLLQETRNSYNNIIHLRYGYGRMNRTISVEFVPKAFNVFVFAQTTTVEFICMYYLYVL